MVAPTPIKQVAAKPGEGPGPLLQPVTEGKKRSSHTINCLAKAAFMGPLPAKALAPIEFPEVKEHLFRAY
jgi:hypothetical protein